MGAEADQPRGGTMRPSPRTEGLRADTSDRVRAIFEAIEDTAAEIVAAAEEEAKEHLEAARARSGQLVQERVDRLGAVSEALMADAEAIAGQLRGLATEIDRVREGLLAEGDADVEIPSRRRTGRFTRPAVEVTEAHGPDAAASGRAEGAQRKPGGNGSPLERLRELKASLEPADEDEDDHRVPRARGLSLHERFRIDDPAART